MKNEYEIRGEITAIFINSPKYGELETLISTSKLDRAKEFQNTWAVSFKKSTNTFYVNGKMSPINGKQTTVILHRWLTGAPDRMVVDHVNHDGLNNTDDNLRVCTNVENLQNRKGAIKNSKSGIRGVSWHKQSKKWQANITVNQKQIFLGTFTDINEAEQVVVKARSEKMPYSVESA